MILNWQDHLSVQTILIWYLIPGFSHRSMQMIPASNWWVCRHSNLHSMSAWGFPLPELDSPCSLQLSWTSDHRISANSSAVTESSACVDPFLPSRCQFGKLHNELYRKGKDGRATGSRILWLWLAHNHDPTVMKQLFWSMLSNTRSQSKWWKL